MKNKERFARGFSLVKCKDCHYYVPAYKGCDFTGNEVAEDGFCSEGAQKLDPRVMQLLHDAVHKSWLYRPEDKAVCFLGTDSIFHGVVEIVLDLGDEGDDAECNYRELLKETRDIIGTRIVHIPYMLDLFCDVLSDCKLSDGMRSAITQVLCNCKWRGH